jgi:hypothetical protein
LVKPVTVVVLSTEIPCAVSRSDLSVGLTQTLTTEPPASVFKSNSIPSSEPLIFGTERLTFSETTLIYEVLELEFNVIADLLALIAFFASSSTLPF